MIRPLDRLDACAAKTVGLRLAIRQGLGLSQAPILRFGVDKVFEAAALEIADNRQNERQADHERDRTDIDFKGVKILHPLFIDMTLGSVTLKKRDPFRADCRKLLQPTLAQKQGEKGDLVVFLQGKVSTLKKPAEFVSNHSELQSWCHKVSEKTRPTHGRNYNLGFEICLVRLMLLREQLNKLNVRASQLPTLRKCYAYEARD